VGKFVTSDGNPDHYCNLSQNRRNTNFIFSNLGAKRFTVYSKFIYAFVEKFEVNFFVTKYESNFD
jgi:hypothetical protein